MKKNIQIVFKRKLIAILFAASIAFGGCKKFITVEAPVTSVTNALVYNNDALATAVMTGIYTQMSQSYPAFAGSLVSTSLYLGLYADEFSLYNAAVNAGPNSYYTNTLLSNGNGIEYWNFYTTVFACNAAVEGLTTSEKLNPLVKKQLLGEAKFIRSLCFFYLVNLYGDIPLPLSSDYKLNSAIPRTPVADVYKQLIADLTEAKSLLSASFLQTNLINGTTERVRPTKWAAISLLSRIHLYNKEYSNAEAQASEVINNTAQFALTGLNDVFKKNSTEAIWQLQPVNIGWNTEDAKAFIIPSTGPGTANSSPVYLSSALVSAFEIGDNRKSNWIGNTIVAGTTYYFPNKYKVNTQNASVSEYQTMFRLAEQYLIRAEARAQLSKSTEALADLNVIRSRAGLSSVSTGTQASILAGILRERQVELFTEMGQRWFDIRRNTGADMIMSAAAIQKNATWQTSKLLFPIPSGEIRLNGLLTQNPGY